jgi:hypothetical protein
VSNTATRRRVELTDGRVVIRRIIVETEDIQRGTAEMVMPVEPRPTRETDREIARDTVSEHRTGWRRTFRRHR